MADMNRVNLIGRLTRDPELRSLPSGTSVCDLRLAFSERYKDGATGEWTERSNYVDVTVFGGQAEACSRYLEKGRPVGVDGRLRYEEWEDKNGGGKRSKHKVVADSVQFLGDGKHDGGGRREERPDADEDFRPAGAVAASDDTDIPFLWEGPRSWADRYHDAR